MDEDKKTLVRQEIIEKVKDYLEKNNAPTWTIAILPIVMELVFMYSNGRLKGHERKDVVMVIMRQLVPEMDSDTVEFSIECFIAAARGAYKFTNKNIFRNFKCCKNSEDTRGHQVSFLKK